MLLCVHVLFVLFYFFYERKVVCKFSLISVGLCQHPFQFGVQREAPFSADADAICLSVALCEVRVCACKCACRKQQFGSLPEFSNRIC